MLLATAQEVSSFRKLQLDGFDKIFLPHIQDGRDIVEDDVALLLVHLPPQLHHAGADPPVDAGPLHLPHFITVEQLDTALEKDFNVAIDNNLPRLDGEQGWRGVHSFKEKAR